MRVDVDERPDLAQRFSISVVPTLVLAKERRVIRRVEGRVSAPKIDCMLAEHLEARADACAA